MIPVPLLNIEPHHSVLDMCAAPGSKTVQILEFLHSGPGEPTGFVVANDKDSKRTCMLSHQTRRINSPCLLITSTDATQFPSLKHSSKHAFKFDRILCDVPCSGDGTMRKNKYLWKSYHPAQGVANHPLQLNILERGIQLLKKGGRLVYSTCSLSPVENEAVVTALLLKFRMQVHLVDVSEEVHETLKYRPGMINWKVYFRPEEKVEARWFESYSTLPDRRKRAMKETLFNETYT